MAEKKYTLENGWRDVAEAGTLIVVFTPLYQLFEAHTPRWSIVIVILVLGITAFVGGIEVERRRS